MTVPARPGPNLVWQQYRPDPKFFGREIALLLRADQLLYEQTGGRIVVTPTDHEVSLSWHLERFLGADRQTKEVEEQHRVPVDGGIAPIVCLGWADRDGRRIGLVGDRLSDDELFVAVAEHEWLHTLGAHHVPGGNVLGSSPRGTCFNRADAEEVARVLGCAIGDLAICY